MLSLKGRWRQEMSKALGILGIARKAGKVEIGEEMSSTAAHSRKARALFTASDAAENTVRRVVNSAESAGVPHIVLPCTKEELGAALGVKACAAIAITDAGLAANIAEKLEAEMPGKFTEALETLSRISEKIDQRKKEARAHERKLKAVKHASSKRIGRNTNG